MAESLNAKQLIAIGTHDESRWEPPVLRSCHVRWAKPKPRQSSYLR